MNRPIEEITAAEPDREAHPDDEVGREYEELSEMEDLDALGAPAADEGALLEVAGELALVRDELEELATLEDREAYAATHLAESETTEDRVTRSFEGMELDELETLAHWDEEPETRDWPEDFVEHAGEYLGA